MEIRYINHFLNGQLGRGLQDIGSPYKSRRVFQHGSGQLVPIVVQEGEGIGTFFQNLYHLVKPLIYSGLKAVKSEAKSAGKNILTDIATKPLTQLLSQHGSEALSNLQNKAADEIRQMRGKGVKRRQKTIKTANKRFRSQSIEKHQVSKAKKLAKKPRVLDIFDD